MINSLRKTFINYSYSGIWEGSNIFSYIISFLLKGTIICWIFKTFNEIFYKKFDVKSKEVWGNNRSVMPLDILGCTRATLTASKSSCDGLWRFGAIQISHRHFILVRKDWVIFRIACRAGNRPLQLLVLNEEFLVIVVHQTAMTKSLFFVHTARRSYRLNDVVKSLEIDWMGVKACLFSIKVD